MPKPFVIRPKLIEAMPPEQYVDVRPIEVYIRLALTCMAEAPSLLDFSLPTVFVERVIKATRSQYDSVRHIIVESYAGQTRLFLYIVPDPKE